MQEQNLRYWLALVRTSGIGPTKGKLLLDSLGSIDAIFQATPATLKNLGLGSKTITNIIKPQWELVAQDLEWLKQPENNLITIEDELYPQLLREISDPPLALFVVGDPKLLATPQIGIVGSRNPSHAGLDNAYDFAKYLAQIDLTITSGLALGIDTESHKGALAVSGKTISVLGTGIDKIYPASNKSLAKQILAGDGAIISELPPGIPPKAENFPRRNRIISGLSTGVLVIEATIRSGSLITARLATEQGREVFAIPGSIHNPLARGCHQLIRQGAKLVETAQDVVEELGPLIACTKTNDFKVPKLANKLDSTHQNLLNYVDYELTPIDLIIERSSLNAGTVSSMLLTLELQNHIKAIAGGYVKT